MLQESPPPRGFRGQGNMDVKLLGTREQKKIKLGTREQTQGSDISGNKNTRRSSKEA